MRNEVWAMEEHRNKSAQKIRWQFITGEARVKLTRLYPKL
jgi:hypothetical protein